jgi:hypothetical protein
MQANTFNETKTPIQIVHFIFFGRKYSSVRPDASLGLGVSKVFLNASCAIPALSG